MGSTLVELGTLRPSAIWGAQCCSAVCLNGKSPDMQSFNEVLQGFRDGSSVCLFWEHGFLLLYKRQIKTEQLMWKTLFALETLWVRETAREDAANPKYLFSFPQNPKNFSLWFPVDNKTDSLRHSTFSTGGELQLKTNQSRGKMLYLPLNMWFSLNKIFIYLSRPECIIRRL